MYIKLKYGKKNSSTINFEQTAVEDIFARNTKKNSVMVKKMCMDFKNCKEKRFNKQIINKMIFSTFSEAPIKPRL